jgi:hypothetical protein
MQTQIDILEECLEDSVGEPWEQNVSDALYRAKAFEQLTEVLRMKAERLKKAA